VSAPRRSTLEWILLTLLLLAAAWFRFYDLGNIPRGLEHDEVATWHMIVSVLEGERPIYFEEGYGHEPLYNYMAALPTAIWGQNWLGERFWAPWLGMFAVAATYALMRRLFGPVVGLSAAGFQATVLWAFFFNRLGLRLNLLPFLLCVALYCFWRGVELVRAGRSLSDTSPKQQPAGRAPSGWAGFRSAAARSRLFWFAAAGLWIGVCFYTYMSSRMVPVIAGVFSVYLLAHDLWLEKGPRPTVRQLAARWWPLLTCFLVAGVVMAPLALYLLDRPADTTTPQREGQVDWPLRQLLRGDPMPVLENAWAIAKMWNLDGERYWQLNYSHRPVFVEPISGILFWIGLAVSLWRWKRPRFALLLIWIGLGMVPSLLTSEAPSWPRTMLASPAALALPAIGALGIGELGNWGIRELGARLGAASESSIHADRESDPSLPKLLRTGLLALLVVSHLLTALLTYRDYLVIWPRHPRVRYAFQSSLTEALHFLDAAGDVPAVVMAGLSPHDMDPWTERSTLRRGDLDLRWVDTRSALVLPAGMDAWLVTLDITPLESALADWADLSADRILAQGEIVARGGTEHEDEAPVFYDPAYTVYSLDLPALQTRIQEAERAAGVGGDAFAAVSLSDAPEFGGLVRLAGYEWLTPLRAGAPAQLATYWRALDTGPGATRYGEPALRTFVHLLDQEQSFAAGVDVLGAAADTWQAGDTVVQFHSLTLPAEPGLYAVEVGWYVPPDGPRLPLDGGHGDRVLLAPVEVRP
jgi:hypothetical protein